LVVAVRTGRAVIVRKMMSARASGTMRNVMM
jgi:hypothetical protein